MNENQATLIGKAYELLSDDHSRKLLKNRALFDITGNVGFMFDMVDDALSLYGDEKYAPNRILLDFARERHNEFHNTNEKINLLIWGTHGNEKTDLLFRMLYNYKLLEIAKDICFVENNPTLYGKHINPIPEMPDMRFIVRSPKELSAIARDPNTFAIANLYRRETSQSVRNQLLALGFDSERIVMPAGAASLTIGDIYYESDIIKLADSEVFIDAGPLDMDETLTFFAKRGTQSWRYKAYAFEPDAISYERCKQAVDRNALDTLAEVINAGLYSENTNLPFLTSGGGGASVDFSASNQGKEGVSMVKLDDWCIRNEVVPTFIKMDIEGSEMPALAGCSDIIKRYKPKLVVSVYHRPMDAVTLTLFLNSLRSDYSFYLRHHSAVEWDTVLYAI